MNFEMMAKPSFTHQLLALPLEHGRQVSDKIETVLCRDPKPDGHLKKRLHNYEGNICRLRCGDYRVVYSYGDGWFKLLCVKNRKDVYKDEYFPEPPDTQILKAIGDDEPRRRDSASQPSKLARPAKGVEQYLPTRIDAELLSRLRVPEAFYDALIACRSEEELLNANVPGKVLERVIDAVMSGALPEVLAEPDLVVQREDDLLRFVEGDLLGFLLKLDSVQERVVDWGMRGTGPILVKGGPGTGKSTIALYRVQAMIRALQAQGNRRPRVLFTTYTTALVSSSQQLLRRLLGPDAACVEVRTADSVVASILSSLGIRHRYASRQELKSALYQAIRGTHWFDHNSQGRMIVFTVPKVSDDYLLEEIDTVIEGRDLESLEEYFAAWRAGRRVPLNARQRTSIWDIHTQLITVLDRKGISTYARARAHALKVVRAGAGPEPYDGVVVDEVQDLDPTVLRLLVCLCAKPNRLFITADANQSIYGGSFRWADVHEDLKFRGRTQLLHTNYRSTREIGEAAASYLRNGALDDYEQEQGYVESGPEPAVRSVASSDDEARLLASFLTRAARTYHLGIGSCAVLVPENTIAEAVAERLRTADVPAMYMSGKELDLERPVVKVINLKSAKGLEFPIVALAGFVECPAFGLQREGQAEEQEEHLERERRSMFVGMTRAMRALLVVTPAGTANPLLQGFDERLWNVRALAAAR